MKLRCIYIILFFIVTLNSYGQISENLIKSKYKRTSEAYGYLLGQEHVLNLIKKEFPQLELNVLKAQMSFNSTFGKTKKGIEIYLKEYLGKEKYREYEEKLTVEIQKILNNQLFTKDSAIEYILQVESRSKGNINSTVLETLLSFEYYDRPQDEFISGFTKIFRTNGHPKSKSTDWQIRIPMSWKAEEADRPNIIQKFISDYGSGNQSIMLVVKELPKNYKLTSAEINLFFSENEIKGMVPEGGKFISFTKIRLDNNIGGMLEFEQISKNFESNVKIRMLSFMFLNRNKLYSLQCTVGSQKIDIDLSLDMKKFLPLYKLVANTIVVNQSYK